MNTANGSSGNSSGFRGRNAPSADARGSAARRNQDPRLHVAPPHLY